MLASGCRESILVFKENRFSPVPSPFLDLQQPLSSPSVSLQVHLLHLNDFNVGLSIFSKDNHLKISFIHSCKKLWTTWTNSCKRSVIRAGLWQTGPAGTGFTAGAGDRQQCPTGRFLVRVHVSLAEENQHFKAIFLQRPDKTFCFQRSPKNSCKVHKNWLIS